MKVLLINGCMDSHTDTLQPYLDAFADHRLKMGDEVKQIALAGKTIHPCIGCYSCWLKTPGLCCFKDDQEAILKKAVWADQLFWASPVNMGFVTSAIKNATDRMLPMAHPFIKMNGDRMAHYLRYDKTPKIGLLLQTGPDLDKETIDIIASMHRRYAIILTTEKTPKEAADETYHI